MVKKSTSLNTFNPDHRMKILKMAMDLESARGVDGVLSAYDKMVDRIGEGMFILGGPDIKAASLVERFIEQMWDKKPGAKIQASRFYDALCSWCDDQGVEESDLPTLKRVGRVMRTMFDVRESNVVYYLGLEQKGK